MTVSGWRRSSGAPETPESRTRHWEADVVAADGGVVHLRPIRPERRRRAGRHPRQAVRAHPLPALLLGRIRASRSGTCTASPMSTTTTGSGWSPCSAARSSRAGRYDRLARRRAPTPRSRSSSRTPSRAGGSVRCCWSTWPRPPGSAGIQPVHCRGAGREHADAAGVHATPGTPSPAVRLRRGRPDLRHRRRPSSPGRSCAEREHRAEARSIARLLVPAVGRGHRRQRRPGQDRATSCCANLLRGDFAGPVYPINPEARLGRAACGAYPTVHDVPDPVDLAVVAVPAAAVAEVVEQCGARACTAWS